MNDIIHLLPEHVANQIAAGEVIQRPASAVKELLENAVDSGARKIDLVVKEAGRTLIQVTDNGCGMSAQDAHRCIQRHATSKIHSADDLFAIRTFGFRGEALASIASVSQMEIRTRMANEDIGLALTVEASEVKEERALAMPEGTTIAVKNLFFNVPARRKFLKSNTSEFRHILEEFHRVVLVQPDIAFSLTHNAQVVHRLAPARLLQRVITLFGDQYRERMLAVELNTEQFRLVGYVGKPEFARKTRGEQYFFANQRFIRHPYLHHAVMGAYHDLIPESSYPAYFLFIDVHPSTIDVNIHPTKTEIKFQDERLVYGMLKSAVREALGRQGGMPSLEFDAERSFELPPGRMEQPVRPPTVSINPDFNPFLSERPGNTARDRHNRDRWTELFSPADRREPALRMETGAEDDEGEHQASSAVGGHEYERVFQLQGTYIVSSIKSGILVVHQQRAHERVLYERFIASIKTRQVPSQQQLFPVNMHLPPADALILRDILPELRMLGLDIREMSGDSFVVDGIPSGRKEGNIVPLVEAFLESYKEGLEQHTDRQANAARSLARSMAVGIGQILKKEEMHSLIDDLFACATPGTAPDGRPCLVVLGLDELAERFRK